MSYWAGTNLQENYYPHILAFQVIHAHKRYSREEGRYDNPRFIQSFGMMFLENLNSYGVPIYSYIIRVDQSKRFYIH